jgi:large subunit ribosomal protein L4
MKTKMYNVLGKEVGDVELADNVFNVVVKPEVVHEVFVAQMNNQREPWADTKKRGEVSGGGKKPWQQKGTGRARHGSIRSPIWKGGGVTFGPLTERSYKTKINKKTRRLATAMCLSDKAQNQGLLVVDDFSFTVVMCSRCLIWYRFLAGWCCVVSAGIVKNLLVLRRYL